MELDSDIDLSVLESLNANGIGYEVIPCLPDFADTAEFCSYYGYPLENSGNTIIVVGKGDPKRFAACIVRATVRLDVNHTVRTLLGVRRASFASREETKEMTSMQIGGVTIFGLPPTLPIYMDSGLRNLEFIIVGSGTRHSKLKLHPSELEKIPGASFIEHLIIE